MRTVSTEQFVANIKAGRVRCVLPLIAEQARIAWLKLPTTEQILRSVQDLIQEGINHTVVYVVYKFDKTRHVKFTTYLTSALENFYRDIVRSVYRQKRLSPHGLLSLDTTQCSVINGRKVTLQKLLSKSRYETQEERIIYRIDAERMFLKAYRNASPLLRRYLIRWLLQPKPSRMKPGADQTLARKEFRKVACPVLNSELCEVIQNDYLCRNAIADRVCTEFRTAKRQSSNDFLTSEEWALTPVISSARFEQLVPAIG
jgi:hypothetical protein